ncbi:MAG: type I toxin-antitoxin system SymE family toxin [Bacteroidetes bacterium]|nr:type I toxin-antitoxin system SymE family toxin [Bacteroidota bacterium]
MYQRNTNNFTMLEHQEKERYLTIQGKSRTTNWSYNRKIKIPEIRMNGLWLAEQGFYPSKKIKVTIRKEVLVIQPLAENVYE